MITGIHHIALIVSSEESIGFYKRLGFREVFRNNRSYDTVVLLLGYEIELEFFVDSSHPPRLKLEPLGPRHIAFRVDRIEETMAELGIETKKVSLDWIGRRYCNIIDPDGNTVELHE